MGMAEKKRKDWKHMSVRIAVILLVIIIIVGVVCISAAYAVRKTLVSNADRAIPVVSDNAAAKAEQYIEHNGSRYEYDRDNINILFIGVDSRGEDISVGQADLAVLAVMNLREKTVRFININRDSLGPVRLFGVAGQYITTRERQIALAYSYGDDAADGGELMSETISGLLDGIPVNGFVALDFDGIATMNEIAGGVSVTAICDVSRAGINEGETVKLTDEQAVYYVTERDSHSADIGTNASRMERQKQYIYAWLDIFMDKLRGDPLYALEAYDMSRQYVTTDMTKMQMAYLAVSMKNPDISDEMYSLPGSYSRSGYYDEYLVDKGKLSDMLIEIFYKKME